MIKITNICPVCRSVEIYEFKDSDRGDDFPEDGVWGVPCADCQVRLVNALKPTDEADRQYLGLIEGCLFNYPESVVTARKLISGKAEVA